MIPLSSVWYKGDAQVSGHFSLSWELMAPKLRFSAALALPSSWGSTAGGSEPGTQRGCRTGPRPPLWSTLDSGPGAQASALCLSQERRSPAEAGCAFRGGSKLACRSGCTACLGAGEHGSRSLHCALIIQAACTSSSGRDSCVPRALDRDLVGGHQPHDIIYFSFSVLLIFST